MTVAIGNHRSRVRRVALVVVAASVLATPALLNELTVGRDTSTPLMLVGNANGNGNGGTVVVNNGICDVDGVDVSYESLYSQAPVPGYKVFRARVSGLDTHCGGADVTIVLSNGTAIAPGDPTRTVVVNPNNGFITADFTQPGFDAPLSSWVNLVSITLAGGTLPIPVQCTMHLERSFLGATGSDPVAALTGTNQNDVLFGLEGNDTYDALNGDDCVKTGNGNNTVRMGSGADVVVAGNGNNTLVATNGAGNDGDRIVAGNGNNTITLGTNGGNNVTAGTGSNTVTIGNGPNTVLIAGSSTSTTRVTFGSGTNTVTVQAGTSIIRLRGGDRSQVNLAGGDDHIYIAGGKNNVIAASGGVDTCHIAVNLRSKNNLAGCDVLMAS